MRPKVCIQSIAFSDGRTYSFEPSDKVLVVGPNNAGKSLALREIKQIVSSTPGQKPLELCHCVRGLTFTKSGTAGELRQYVIAEGLLDTDKKHGRYYSIGQYTLNIDASNWFDSNQFGEFSNLFFRHVSTENRLHSSAMSENVAAGKPKTNAQQVLYDDTKTFERVSSQFRDAFGASLVMDYRGGTSIPIHVGDEPQLHPGEDRISDSYVKRVRALPRLDTQGDGMRSFAGILFEATVTKHDVTLIDEPEAFLHPPQMRRLARTLASDVSGQLFVSTHSSDVLRGFLDSPNGSIRILRLQRSGDVNETTETDPQTLRELWDNPDLKYSNALDSIFHEVCVLCEDDSDCRFYNAVADYQAELDNDRWPDAIYVPCGGKHSVPRLASALRQLGVPVHTILDIDALSDEIYLKKLVESFGDDWSVIEKLWKDVNSAVTKGVKPLSHDQIKTRISEILNEEVGLPKSKIVETMRSDSPWSIVKMAGKGAIPRGQATISFGKLEKALRKIGIFIVPVGQVEGFAPDIGKHGPAFVSEALKKKSLGGSDLKAARNFVKSVAGPSSLKQ